MYAVLFCFFLLNFQIGLGAFLCVPVESNGLNYGAPVDAHIKQINKNQDERTNKKLKV
jgi:hypothetical protein